MGKMILNSLMATILLGSISSTYAQQLPKVPRIGFAYSSGNPYSVEAFRQGLRDLGYVDGKNIVIEYRSAETKLDRIPGLVAELVQLKVDVLVSTAEPAIERAKQATKTIPIVMLATFDPVATGIVDSLARPGGNITGISTLARELSSKRLELLKEAVPGISRVALLWNPNEPGTVISFKEYETAARALKIPLQSLEVRGPNPDFEGAFRDAAKGHVNALISTMTPLLVHYAKRIADLAIKNRLPLMVERGEFVEAGGLMSYSANDAE